MDGNGRWASTRGCREWPDTGPAPRPCAAPWKPRRIWASRMLTVYAFSSDNWRRPQPEVSALMKMFHTYLRREQARCVDKGVRVSVIGRRDRLPRLLLPVIEECESATALGRDAASAPGRRLFLARRDPGRRSIAQRQGHARSAFRSARRSGRRSADPHRRRAAAERFPALGMRLRRAAVHSGDVAGLRRVRPGHSRQRIPLSRAAIWRAARAALA